MKHLHQKNNSYSKIISTRELEARMKRMLESPRTRIVNESLRKEKL